jgi:ribosomal protein S18 acetylase RimI-like enzyme
MYSIQIVPATIDDAALIAEISRETFYDTYAADNTKEDMDLYLTTKFADEQILAELEDPLHLFLLAYVGDTLAGYVKLKDATHASLGTDPAMEVARFYARKNFHGKGVGKAMMEACITHAKVLNRQWLWLVVWKQNPRGIQFYQSAGFSICAEAIFVLGEDVQYDWVMKKSLQ